MNKADLENLINNQKAFFETHQTLDIGYRKEMLKKLQKAILSFEKKLESSLFEDLHKPAFEVYFETGQILKEIRIHLKHLSSWAREKRVPTPILLAVSSSYIRPEPYGRVLIFSPWNYPLLLLLSPLVGALSAGNCVTLKPSGRLPRLNETLSEMFSTTFDPSSIALVTGGHDTADQLLSLPWDYIFFTGSQGVGKRVLKAAAEHLTPVTLELGGKNPCIVTADADINIAARRITWGKFLNAGQSCVAPDYVAVDQRVKDKLVRELIRYTIKDFGPALTDNPDFTGMVGKAAVHRQVDLLKNGKVLLGGNADPERRTMSPTILEVSDPGAPALHEEIFGPVLPVIEYSSLKEVYLLAQNNPNPLSLYLFTNNRNTEKEVLRNIPSGGYVRNDTVIQFVNPYLPLGGKNQSGTGHYHGYYSFKTFSHMRAIMRKRNFPDFPIRYLPYTSQKYYWLRKLLK